MAYCFKTMYIPCFHYMFQKQLEMDVKIMLDLENINKKAVLKQQGYETRLPRITKRKPALVSNFCCPADLHTLAVRQWS